MALRLHRSDHPDLLVDALCDVVVERLNDPFAAEIIAVPTRGVDRWLTQRIASSLAARGVGDGVAANIEFPFPSRLVGDILARSPETARSVEAWSIRTVVSHLEGLIDRWREEPWMRLVARFAKGPDGDGTGAQRLRAAQKIARLFSSYARYRPNMINQWTAGEDVGPDGAPVPSTAAWQPTMWRLLREEITEPPLLETLPGALTSLRDGAASVELPERISIYGVTTVDPIDMAVLDAVGTQTVVHMFLLHPSAALWQTAAPIVAEHNGSAKHIRRSHDPTRVAAGHPLLRSWAQESRELQTVLRSAEWASDDGRTTDDTATSTLLRVLQRDIRANQEPSSLDASGDRSIQIHACYGPRRQVEVVRDAILHILAADPTLEPRDVVVMTPDLETYAPLMEAAFPASRDTGAGLPDLRVRIADRAPSRTNPLVKFAGSVVDLAASRIGTSHVRQLMALPEVRRRLGVDTDTAADMADLVDNANVRWGLDAAHREREGAGSREEHTWRRGIDRILAGVFFTDSPIRTVGGIAPLAQVEGRVTDAGGYLALLIERIRIVAEMLGTPDRASEWAEKISTAVRLLAEPRWGDEWQWAHLDRLLVETFPPRSGGTPDLVIGLDEAAVLLTPWTEDRPGVIHHRTGDVTVCTLVPMRSVPYRVVCLIGMEHDRFPRASRHDGDDLLADDEVVGDPDRSAGDRQLLLDAVMAAGDHVVITFTGRDPLTNAAYPPAVPIAELQETIAAMVGQEAADRLRIDHPLQSFSPVVFAERRLIDRGPWGFDPIQHAGAVALSNRPSEDRDGSPLALEDVIVEAPTLDRLTAYLRAPSRTFLRGRLGMFIPEVEDPPDDDLPTGLNALEQWAVTGRLLSGVERGHDPARLTRAERAADAVPAGDLAAGILTESLSLAQRIQRVAADRGCDAGAALPITGAAAVLGEPITGSVLADPISGLVCDIGPSRGKPARRLALYARVAFLTAIDPGRAWRGVIVGRGDRDTVGVVTIGPLGADEKERSLEAARRLADLVDLYREGMGNPLPIFTETSFAWAAAGTANPVAEAAKTWEPNWEGKGGEREEPEHRTLFPGLATVTDLAETAFPEFADRLWTPILEVSHEENL